MAKHINWEAPPLSAEDERLVRAYANVGHPLDDLPYTAEFEKLLKALKLDPDDEIRRSVFKRLLSLRKMGRLPRVAVPA